VVTELEGGFDASLFGSRAQLAVTGYRRNITQLLLSRVLPPSTGFSSETFNGGEMLSSGLEVSLQGTPVERGNFTWTTNTTFTRNRTHVSKLPVPEFSPGNGFGNSFGGYRIAVGYSPTTVFANWGHDATTGAQIVKPLGESEPSFQMGFQNDFKLGRFTMASLLDWSHGGLVVNLTRNYYDEAGTAIDFDAPAGTPRNSAGQITSARPIETCGAKCLTGEERLFWYHNPNNYAVYVEDGSFLKLREVSLSYDIPTAVLGRKVTSAQLQLSGRNLVSWFPYSGYDPEVSNFGNVAAGRNQDVTPFPPSRTFWLGINLVF